MIKKITTFFDEYNSSGDYDAAIKSLKKEVPDLNIRYVSTDGWRGYYTATVKRGRPWREIEDERLAGWVTGDWDDAPTGASSSEHESILGEYGDRDIMVVYLPTSNVFSTAYNIFERVS